MACFISDGLRFEYTSRGLGAKPFFFQHGIGGTQAQPLRFLDSFDNKQSGAGTAQALFQQLRLLTFDFRAHGRTPVGDPEKLRLDVFADDLVSLINHLQVESAMLGGISMGAAVALNAALRYRERCVALVLVRPAWLNGSMCPTAIAAYKEVINCLQHEPSPQRALEKLERSEIYSVIIRQSADAGRSLLGQLRGVVSDPSLRSAVLARLHHLPSNQPDDDLQRATEINVPTLVLAAPGDPIHPLSYAREIAAAIPGSTYIELAPKQLDEGPYVQEVSAYLLQFLNGLASGSNLTGMVNVSQAALGGDSRNGDLH
jgi:pimeloyl-ACP methyl ester carboxylesterase